MTLYGYDSNWTNVVQGVSGTNSFGEHLVNYNNNLYLVGDGLGKLIVITGTVGPEILSTTAFSYTDTNSLTGNAIVAESKIWFTVSDISSGNHLLYSWNGSGNPSLVNTFTDGVVGRAVVGWDGSDIYVAYSKDPTGLYVRLRDGGAWTDTGFTASSSSIYEPLHTYASGGEWYVTGFFTDDTVYWFLATSNVNIDESNRSMNDDCTFSYVSNPLIFGSDLFVAAEGDNTVLTDPNPILWKFNTTTGVRTQEADIGASFPAIARGGQLIEYGTSLYLCIAESGGLYKSDGADTTTWSQVTS